LIRPEGEGDATSRPKVAFRNNAPDPESNCGARHAEVGTSLGGLIRLKHAGDGLPCAPRDIFSNAARTSTSPPHHARIIVFFRNGWSTETACPCRRPRRGAPPDCTKAEFYSTPPNPLLLAVGYQMTGKHLSLMEYVRHDNVVRIVDVEREQMPRLVNRWLRCPLGARLEVIGKVPHADVVNRPHADSIWIFCKVPQRLIQQAPVSLACPRAEILATASKCSGDVALGRAGDPDSPHAP
jgi:hypothetical protein